MERRGRTKMLAPRCRLRSRPVKTHPLQVASFKHAAANKLIIRIPRSSIYPLGASNSAGPLFRDVSWTIQPDDAWAIVSTGSGGSKTALLQALTGHLRIHPPPPPPDGLFPFLTGLDPHKYIDLVSFAHRPRTAGGAFYDFTARYGAVREEDKRTLRETFFPELAKPLHELAVPDLLVRPDENTALHVDRAKEVAKRKLLEELTETLGLKQFLDLPMVALSNGQTRRARIIKALLEQPKLLILDEPLSASPLRLTLWSGADVTWNSWAGHLHPRIAIIFIALFALTKFPSHNFGDASARSYTRLDNALGPNLQRRDRPHRIERRSPECRIWDPACWLECTD